MVQSFLSPGTASKIEGYVQRGLSTAMAVVTPPRMLSIRRLDESNGTFDVALIANFHLRIQNRMAMDVAEESIEAQQISGTMKRILPIPVTTRLKPGDRFTIAELGPATIKTVFPDRFGIEMAEWILEEGAP